MGIYASITAYAVNSFVDDIVFFIEWLVAVEQKVMNLK